MGSKWPFADFAADMSVVWAIWLAFFQLTNLICGGRLGGMHGELRREGIGVRFVNGRAGDP